MKKLLGLLLANLLFAFGLNASEPIKTMKVLGNVSNLTPDSKAWLSASFSEVMLYPQTALIFFDKIANKMNANNGAKKVEIKALYDGKNISFLLKWRDATRSVQKSDSSTLYGDGVAFQFAQNYDNVKTLPYIGMGSEGRAVVIHLAKASEGVYEPNGKKDVYHQVNPANQNLFGKDLQTYEQSVENKKESEYQRNFIAQGFRSMTQIRDENAKIHMYMQYKNGFWEATLSQPLKTEYLNLDNGAFPIAIAVWDGEKKNRDGLKSLSSWVSVKLVGKSGGDKLINALSAMPQGDIKNGEKIALENCTACHRYKNEHTAAAFMAPNLSNIGGYATKEYLKESIEHPNAVIVPGYNIKAHPNYPWYTLNQEGKRVSTMPPYDWMDEKSKNDLVAFLATLKEGEE
jgi:complex iron-sulfur molybdoenzyme family reductase subunit gamma